MKMTFIKINERFLIGVDTYNWILKDKDRGINNQNSYFSKPEKIAREIAWRYEKDAIARGELDYKKYLNNNTLLHAQISELLEDVGWLVKEKLEKLKSDLKKVK